MSWILIQVASDLLAASNVVMAKEMLSRCVFDRRCYLFCVALVSLPFAVVGCFNLFTHFSPLEVLFCLLAGIAYITAGYFYYRAVSTGEPFRVSLILRFGAVFILLLSVLLLG